MRVKQARVFFQRKAVGHAGELSGAIAQHGLERAVCDYIAGMTDRFALEEYARLFDPHTRP